MSKSFASCHVDREKRRKHFFPEIKCLISVSVVSCIKNININIEKRASLSLLIIWTTGELETCC